MNKIFTKNELDFIEYISHKNITIVGPSVSINKCNLGKIIDNSDIVIRINKYYKICNVNDYGKNIDILFYNFYDTIQKNNFLFNKSLSNNFPKFIISSFPILNDIMCNNINNSIELLDIPHIIYDYSIFDELIQFYNKEDDIIPTSGLTVIYYLLKHIDKIKSLNIYGIDFSNNYTKGYKNDTDTFIHHDMNIDKNVFQIIYSKLSKLQKNKIIIYNKYQLLAGLW